MVTLVDGASSEEAWLMAFNIFLYQYDLYPPLSKQYAGCFYVIQVSNVAFKSINT
jgi:hypothetical protein